MTIEDRIKELDKKYKDKHWFVCAGLAGDSIVIYTKTDKVPKYVSNYKETEDGYRIILQKMSKIWPAI